MTIIATNRTAFIKALLAQGFFLVADLPKPVRLEHTPRGMLIARVS
ncbi:hypothetical protein [Pseudomonas yamanorum]|jgi:hypothetical protein